MTGKRKEKSRRFIMAVEGLLPIAAINAHLHKLGGS